MADRRSDRIEALMKRSIVPPAQKINLKKDYDPGFTGEWAKQTEDKEILA